jgi:hypothetical protein
MAKINNYRFQQQQKAKQEHQKIKKIKKEAKKMPVSASEELDYIKKLLNGEEVEDFGPKEVEYIEYDRISAIEYWSAGVQPSARSAWAKLTHASMPSASNMSLSEYIQLMSGKGYYK